MPEARVVEVSDQGLEEAPARLGARRRRAAPDAHPGLDEPAHEPRPDRPLVIRGVALARAALVARRVAGLAGCERAEAERGHEPRLDRVDDAAGAFPLEHPERPAPHPPALGPAQGRTHPPPPAGAAAPAPATAPPPPPQH